MSGLPTPDIPTPHIEEKFKLETVPGFAINLTIPSQKVKGRELGLLARGDSLEISLVEQDAEKGTVNFLGELVKVSSEDTGVVAAKPGRLQQDTEYMKKLANKLTADFNTLDEADMTKNWDGKETSNPTGLVARRLFPNAAAYKDYEGYIVGDPTELPPDVLERYNAKQDASMGAFLSKK